MHKEICPSTRKFNGTENGKHDSHWPKDRSYHSWTQQVYCFPELWGPIQKQSAHIPILSYKLKLKDKNIKTGLCLTELQQRSDHWACLVPSCATGFKMFSICSYFLEKFLNKVTNSITWTFPLLWFMLHEFGLLLCRPNSNSDITTNTHQIISQSRVPLFLH